MIGLIQNRLEFDYDIRSLIQAFYHGQKIITAKEGTDFTVLVEYKENEVTIAVEKGQNIILSKSAKIVEGQKTAFCQEEKKVNRNETKKLLYAVLSEYTKQQLPWGTMTGVRPTKVGVERLEQGLTSAELEKYYTDHYLVSPQKAKICTKVAKREIEILSDIAYEKEYSLYVGIPFCPSRCLYCSFTSYPIHRYRTMVMEYLEAIFLEMDYVAETNKDRRLTSVYIGGGTPTSLSAEQLDLLLTGMEQRFDLTKVREFTVEAGRPDSIDTDKLKVMKKHPVTRISINPQTMNDETLKLIGRAHNTVDIVRVYEEARAIGFDNINMDIIIGLPGEDISHVKNTMEQLFELKPDSLTVHSMAMKRASELKINLEQYQHLIQEGSNAMLEMVDDYATRMNLEPYYLYRQKNISGNLENVGYSRSGRECLYNILIMEEKQDIIAVGAGASSKYVFPEENRLERAENVKDVEQYIHRINEMIDRKKGVGHE